MIIMTLVVPLSLNYYPNLPVSETVPGHLMYKVGFMKIGVIIFNSGNIFRIATIGDLNLMSLKFNLLQMSDTMPLFY